MIAAFDTNVLIWALPYGLSRARRRKTNQNVADMERRAKILLTELEEKKARIIVPLIAVGEFLVGIEQANHGAVLAEFQKRFFCPPYDLRATVESARLEQAHKGFAPAERVERKLVRPDAMIVASAFVHGARTSYSHEAGVRKMATVLGMNGLDLPTHSENIFVDHEARNQAMDDEADGES